MTAQQRGRAGRAVTAVLLIVPALAIVLVGFVAPLLRLAVLSVSSPRWPLAAYRELATVDVYREVLENTVVLALVVSAASVAIGFALTRLEANWRAAVLYHFSESATRRAHSAKRGRASRFDMRR